jgi:hypothetical protein
MVTRPETGAMLTSPLPQPQQTSKAHATALHDFQRDTNARFRFMIGKN